jgi:DNA-binding NtrC family response regulator
MDDPNSAGIDAVYLTCFDSEFSVLAILLQYSGIRLHRADTLEKADFLLTVTAGSVLLSDVVFLDGDWRDALRLISGLHPRAGFAVAADPADGSRIPDLYERGACGVLWKPVDVLQAIALIRTINQAVRDRSALSR